MPTISSIVTLIVLTLAAIGLLLGLMRGVRRSLVRLVVVLLSALLAFFLATSIAGTALNTPISEFPPEVIESFATGDLQLSGDETFHDLMVAAFQTDETMAQILEAAPTLINFITLLPHALISEILFIVLFFILKVVLWIPEKIIDWVLIRKKGSRLLGAVVGAVQGVVCASILLLPLFAVIPMLDSVVIAANELPEETKNQIEILATIEEIDESFTQQIKSDPVYSILDAVGVRSVGENIFYSLSNVATESGESVCVFGEIKNTLPVFVKFTQLTTVGSSGTVTEADVTTIRTVLTSIGDSALISDTLTEVITAFAQSMEAGEPFLGMTLPSDLDPSMQAFMQDLFSTLADSTKETLLADLSDVIDLVSVFSKHELLTSEGLQDMTALLGDEGFTKELLETMVNSHLLAPVSVSAVNNLGIAMLADALEIPEAERDALKVSNIQIFSTLTETDRTQEAARLAKILAGAMDLIGSMESGFNFEENLSELGKIGALLDVMSDSVLLSNSAKGVMAHFLDMDTVKDVMTENAITLIRQKIQDNSINYESTLGSIAAAYEMANALNVSNPDLSDSEKLTSAVESLFTSMDETTAEILKETIDSEMLQNMGIPEEAADTASTLLGTFFEEVAKVSSDETLDFEKEAAAVETVLGMITEASSGNAPSEAVTDTVIESILESQTITNTVINASQHVDLSDCFSDADRDMVADVLDSYTNDSVDQEKLGDCLDALRAMLGIQ